MLTIAALFIAGVALLVAALALLATGGVHNELARLKRRERERELEMLTRPSAAAERAKAEGLRSAVVDVARDTARAEISRIALPISHNLLQ